MQVHTAPRLLADIQIGISGRRGHRWASQFERPASRSHRQHPTRETGPWRAILPACAAAATPSWPAVAVHARSRSTNQPDHGSSLQRPLTSYAPTFASPAIGGQGNQRMSYEDSPVMPRAGGCFAAKPLVSNEIQDERFPLVSARSVF